MSVRRWVTGMLARVAEQTSTTDARGKVGMVVVGAGGAGARCATAVGRVPGVELLGFHDVDPAAARAFAQGFGGVVFPELEAAASRRSETFAVICTPPGTHAELAIRGLEAGMHVLVEKPFELDLRLLADVERAADRLGRTVGAVAQHRFSSHVRTLRERLDEGVLGEVRGVSIKVRRRRPRAYFESSARDWRRRKAMSGGGVLITVGFHYVDLACHLLGAEAGAFEARLPDHTDGRDADPEGIENAIAGTFKLSGIACHVDARWGDLPAEPDRLRLATSKGTVELVGDTLVGTAPEEIDRYELHARQLRDFVQAIRLGRRPAITPRDVKGSLQVILSLYEAAGR